MKRSASGKFILNADDFAMDEGVDAAIFELAAQAVVTSASALVLSPRWKEAGKALAQMPVSRGLHLDFTSPFARAGSGRSITSLVVNAYGGFLSRKAIRSSIERQFSLYEDVTGEAPAFADGHQHIHQLPIIRQELLSCIRKRYGRRAGVRICSPQRWRGLEAALVGMTGGRALKRDAQEHELLINTDFAGVYSFAETASLPHLWRGWLPGLAGSLPLIMCHPAQGAGDKRLRDPIRGARLREYAWLKGEEFRELCSAAGMVPSPWPALEA